MQQIDAFTPSHSPDGLDEWEDQLLRAIVRSFVVKYRWFWEQREDLLQDLRLHYLRHRDRYDGREDAAPAAFLRTIAGNWLQDRLKHHFTARNNGGVWPLRLDLPIAVNRDGEPECIEKEDERQDPAGEAITAIARARAITRLTEQQRRIVAAFERGATAGEVSAAFGLKPATLYDERQRIRCIFTDEGFAPPRRARPRRQRRCPGAAS